MNILESCLEKSSNIKVRVLEQESLYVRMG